MISPGQRDGRPQVRWRRAICVLGLLAGLLAMHGLAPGGGLPNASRPDTHGRGHGHRVPTAVTAHQSACAEDGHGGGHLRHADGTCASGAVSGGPALPALVPDPVAAVAGAEDVRAHAAEAPGGARAPPSLSELQLLRI
ncbi:DUF6153 family protein [Streptomyces poriticola]|uniref:DUF6153 family protein n=1 Tax=Streptomyces poriticola TaxID=3120506 RepID=UPI002FCE3C60